MEIKDLSQHYLDYRNGHTRLFDYLNSDPAFFEHYLKYWGNGELCFSDIQQTSLEKTKRLIIKSLGKAKQHLTASEISTEDLEVILFVGQGTTNGHAFLNGDTPTAYVALETYNTQLFSNVFVLHEIAHAVHYRQNPSLYFHSQEERTRIGRQLTTEGLATYLTKKLLSIDSDTALWADFLTPEQLDHWKQDYLSKRQDIIISCLNQFHQPCDRFPGLFEVQNIKHVERSRAGYRVGLELISSLVQEENLNLNQVFEITEDQALNALKNLR